MAAPRRRRPATAGRSRWTFLRNHGHVLVTIARNPDLRLREIAEAVGITERAAFRIVSDLEADGYVAKKKVGGRNVYEVHRDRPLRAPLERHHEVGALLGVTHVTHGI